MLHLEIDTNTSDASTATAVFEATISMETAHEALRTARESPNGLDDHAAAKILHQTIDMIWRKVQAQPDGYIMTRDEFAIFNYFQHRFAGDKVAKAARGRYWDNLVASRPPTVQIRGPTWFEDYHET